MPHARRQLREALATVVTGLATTGSRVKQSSMRPQADLPCLLVTMGDEEVIERSLEGLEVRQIETEIIGVAKAAANVDDVLDQIALEVETALSFGNTLGGLAKDSAYQKARIEFDYDLEQPIGVISLKYLVLYSVQAGAPGTIV